MPNAAERQELDTISELTKMNSNALNRMFNPHTGQRISEYLFPVMTGYASGQALLSDHMPSPVAGGAGIIAAALASRGASKLLHSPHVRESVVNKMIKNATKKESQQQSQSYLTDALKASLMNSYNK